MFAAGAVVDGGADDEDAEDGGWEEEVGCAAAGTAGANASRVAASTDTTRLVRETAISGRPQVAGRMFACRSVPYRFITASASGSMTAMHTASMISTVRRSGGEKRCSGKITPSTSAAAAISTSEPNTSSSRPKVSAVTSQPIMMPAVER